MLLNLRIKGPAGATTISISHQSTRDELYDRISHQTNLPKSSLQVRFGFPNPQIIPDSDPTATVESLGIKNGESLQVSSISQHTPNMLASSTTNALPQPLTASNTPLSQSIIKPSDHSIARAPSKSTLSSLNSLQDQRNSSPSTTRSAHDLQQTLAPSTISASVPLEAGHLILRVIPDDNSCLFRAVGILLDRDQSHPPRSDLATRLRQIVADAVRNDPITWSEPILGKPPNLYISKILDKHVWGGAIELAILADHFQTEICSIDVQTGRVDSFGQSKNYPNRIFLVYSGIHYDAITLSPIPPEELSNQSMSSDDSFPPDLDFDTTIFSSDEEALLHAALQLVSQLRQLHYYTDTASFSLRCETCSTALVGEKDARSHAEATGHTQFGEFA